MAATAAGAVALLAAAAQTWATGEVAVPGPSAPAPVELGGSDVAPAAAALGWAALAALGALLATRGWARRAVGALIVIFGATAAYDLWRGTRPDTLARAAADQTTASGDLSTLDLVGQWPVVATIGAVLLLAAGAAAVIRGAAWPGMGSRYDRHSAPSTARAGDPAELWKSLDNGTDPTLDPASDSAAPGRGATAPSGVPQHDRDADSADSKEN
nr:Trp biosynthesis-associated membrane protein [Nocardiopsis mwathae]